MKLQSKLLFALFLITSSLSAKQDPFICHLRGFVTAIQKGNNQLSNATAGGGVLLLVKKFNFKEYKSFHLEEYQKELFGVCKTLSFTPSDNVMQLQGYCDCAYFSKLLHLDTLFVLTEKQLQNFMNEERFNQVENPDKALIYWIMLESLKYSNPGALPNTNKWQKKLEKTVKKNAEQWAYLLAHIILYETQIGNKEPTKKARKAWSDLKKHRTKVALKEVNADIIAEIMICAKLLQDTQDSWYKKAHKLITHKKTFIHFHERCVCLAAVA